MLKVDRDAIDALAGQLNASAGAIRAIDFDAIFTTINGGFAGSDVASTATSAAHEIEDAMGTVAGRIDVLATANRNAAKNAAETDESYAVVIAGLLKR